MSILHSLDFTLNQYNEYLQLIKSKYLNIITFEEYFSLENKPDSFCIIRHDVDRKPYNALEMARLEAELNIKASYYFRTLPHTFLPQVIRQIASLDHEIGYHYENLARAKGNFLKAEDNFKEELAKLRSLTSIKTVAMHGSPLSPYNNLDLWRGKTDILKNKHQILGECYLSIDYKDILYLNDTGRNWESQKNNLRDHVNSRLAISSDEAKNLKTHLKTITAKKLIFQVHPERWNNNLFSWSIQLLSDKTTNFLKSIMLKTNVR